MADKKPNLLERLLFGENVNKGITPVEEKGLFPTDRYNANSWSVPSLLGARGNFGSTIDYRVEAGDLIDSSVVMACLNWLMRVFPRARARVVLETEDGLEPVKGHALTKLLKRPNPVYSGTQLWRCTVLSYNWNGNAYWRKVRNGAGRVIQLWYEPHWTIRPRRSNSEEFVSYYEIYRDGKWSEIPKEDVVHFRWVLSPDNQMLGMGPIDSGLREVFSDNEAARFTAAIFRNFGVFSRMISPKDADAPLSFAEVTRLIAAIQAATTGDNRGRTIGATVPVDMYESQSDMSKLEMRQARMTPEERLCSLIGLHPAITGLAAGSASSTYNNKEEAMRDAYNNNIIPCYDSFSEELDIQLVSDFSTIEDETVEFDVSKIEVLKGDIQKAQTSIANLYANGLITRSQGKIMLGLKPATDGTDDVYRLSPLLEVALLNQGRVSPAVLDAVDTNGEMLPTQDATSADAIAKMLLLPEGKAGLPKPAENLAGRMAADIEAEVMRMYSEAAGKVG